MAGDDTAERDDYPYWSDVPTRWNDNDIYGHVNNTVHYAAMDTVINRWMIEQGILDLGGDDTIGLCVESGCRYLASMEYPDVMAVGLRIAKLGTSSVVWEAAIARASDGTTVAQGRFVHVFVDRESRRPAALTDTARAAFTTLVRGVTEEAS
jgi:acyl-CoA thioester hydrolase